MINVEVAPFQEDPTNFSSLKTARHQGFDSPKKFMAIAKSWLGLSLQRNPLGIWLMVDNGG